MFLFGQYKGCATGKKRPGPQAGCAELFHTLVKVNLYPEKLKINIS
jgi:hypothetical protein